MYVLKVKWHLGLAAEKMFDKIMVTFVKGQDLCETVHRQSSWTGWRVFWRAGLSTSDSLLLWQRFFSVFKGALVMLKILVLVKLLIWSEPCLWISWTVEQVENFLGFFSFFFLKITLMRLLKKNLIVKILFQEQGSFLMENIFMWKTSCTVLLIHEQRS